MRRAHGLAALAAIILLSPIVTWWLVGDLSEAVADPDYSFRPLPLTSRQELAIGATATALVAAALVVVAIAVRRRLVTGGEARALAPLVLAGVFLGNAWRVMTAGVTGANIGAGITLLCGPFVLLGLGLWSAVLWRRRSSR